ncbi:UPF0390 protein zgc136864 [Hydra vulgaris]|uniref:UPF0390 protein zgc136864 n=1 Tax=Hydra vulgaris TaxID=6087 RepID=A0ABM4CSL3_HYDVU
MAQGKMKVKTNFERKPKKAHKPLGPKKGAKVIAPKKAVRIKENNLKSVLQKSINASIERELANKAGTRSLSVVRVESTDADASEKVGNKKQNKKK